MGVRINNRPTTPENVTALEPNEIFVFGSNEAGRHGAGAAKTAHDLFGAEYGVGEGPTGRCYAIPTLNGELKKLRPERLTVYVNRFVMFAKEHPELRFLLTRVGCGLAGLREKDMIELFKSTSVNVIKPAGWYD